MRPAHLLGALGVGLALAPLLMQASYFAAHIAGALAVSAMIFLELRR